MTGDRVLQVRRGVTIDMHGNRLTGIPTPVSGNDPVRLSDLEQVTAGQDSIKALVASIRGLRGDPGEQGIPGNDGRDGEDGRPGYDGNMGPPGQAGTPGKDGLDGRAGKDGRPGQDGAPGLPGRDGLDGKDGKPGKDGKDGSGSAAGGGSWPNGGTPGQVLGITDSGLNSERVNWIDQTGGSGGTPGGNPGELQYNDAGSFGGLSGSVWDALNGNLYIPAAGDISAVAADGLGGNAYYDLDGIGYIAQIGAQHASKYARVTYDADTGLVESEASDGSTSSVVTQTGGHIKLRGYDLSTYFEMLDTGEFNFAGSNELQMNGDPGTAGKALVSQGNGSPPVWDDPAAISSTSDQISVLADDTGVFANFDSLPLFIDNDAGTAAQVLTSNGAGAAPTWEDNQDLSSYATILYVDTQDAAVLSAAEAYADALTTADVAENTNLYFTDERAQDAAFGAWVDGTGIDSVYDDAGNSFTVTVDLSELSTTTLPEGSNLYYTDERVDDRVAALIQNGTGITWSYNDGLNTLTPSVSITQYTDELAQDAVGGMVDVTLDYTDATPLLRATGLTLRVLDEDRTIPDTYCLVVAGYFDLSDFELVLDGDAELQID
jgi:hypothetical protein